MRRLYQIACKIASSMTTCCIWLPVRRDSTTNWLPFWQQCSKSWTKPRKPSWLKIVPTNWSLVWRRCGPFCVGFMCCYAQMFLGFGFSKKVWVWLQYVFRGTHPLDPHEWLWQRCGVFGFHRFRLETFRLDLDSDSRYKTFDIWHVWRMIIILIWQEYRVIKNLTMTWLTSHYDNDSWHMPWAAKILVAKNIAFNSKGQGKLKTISNHTIIQSSLWLYTLYYISLTVTLDSSPKSISQ